MAKLSRRLWSDNELIQTLKLYKTLKAASEDMSSSNGKIINIAKTFGRTPAAIAMRMANYKHLDGNGVGLYNVGTAVVRIWNMYGI